MVPNVAGSNPVVRPIYFPYMTYFQAFLLGIVQGITEFIPVSSSGHLVLLQSIFGFEDPHRYLLFDLVCHLGTLFSIFVIFAKRIASLFGKDVRTLIQVAIGTLPLGILVFLISYIEKIFANPWLLSISFSLTAVLLFLTSMCKKDTPPLVLQKRSWRDAFIVGLFQLVAVVPGISRSGSTIAAARFLGWPKRDAVTFSFLLAIPAILGGLSFEVLRTFFSSSHSLQPTAVSDFGVYAIGFMTSFISGCASLALLIRLVLSNSLVYFAWYCLFLGIFCAIYFSY